MAPLISEEARQAWRFILLSLKASGGSLAATEGPIPEDRWLLVAAGAECMLQVEVSHRNGRHARGGAGALAAVAPRFPKPKDESWFLILGCRERRELLALKRTGSMRATSRHHVRPLLPLPLPDWAGPHSPPQSSPKRP